VERREIAPEPARQPLGEVKGEYAAPCRNISPNLRVRAHDVSRLDVQEGVKRERLASLGRFDWSGIRKRGTLRGYSGADKFTQRA
jgi:hypothetical protein